MSTLEEKIKVMQAAAEGKAIEYRSRDSRSPVWFPAITPSWCWVEKEYRVVEPKKPSINWDHVHPDYKWLARGLNGHGLLCKDKPSISCELWYSGHPMQVANVFTSYTHGDCGWKESLVHRPC